MATLDDFSTAQKIEKTIRNIAKSEIDKQRPAPRYAVVDSIDLEDRSVMARFIGESDAVRIPFLDVIPSTIGQEVRVTGIGSDRAVDGIRGTSDAEARVAQLEAQVAHWSKKAYANAELTADYNTSGTVEKIPINSPIGVTPYHMDVEADGSLLVSIPGDYRYHVTIQTEIYRNNTVSVWIAVLPAGGVQFDVQNLQCVILQGANEYTGSNPFTGVGHIHLNEGDRFYVNGWCANSTILLRKYGTRMSLELVNPDPIVYPE